MNNEQNTTGSNPGTEANGSLTKDTSTQSKPVADNGNAGSQDDYYDVDYGKKDVISTVGDGEMHDEGLVGTGEDTTSDFQSSTERMTDEQDEAESHDSEQ